MEMPDLVGRFDLDLTLRDASLDPANRATRRMLAAAAIGTEVNDGYYAAVELREAVQWVHEGEPGAKLVNRRSIGTPYRRAKGTPLLRCWVVDAGRGFRAAGGVGRA